MNPLDQRSPKISIVVPVKNGASKIERCLEALLDQTVQPSEVIVVDGHSTDATVEIARKFPVQVVFEDYGTVGGARQVGVEHAQGEYVAFTDADCIPRRDWLENLVREFDHGIAGVGGGIKNIGTGLWEESIALTLNTFLGSAYSVQDRVLKGKRIVKGISGCNSMYRKKDLRTVGGFNVRLFVNEDTELNRRIRRCGILFYTPDAIVYHNQERTLREFVGRIHFFGYGRGVNRLWDLQVVPPIAAVGIFSFLFFAPLVFCAMLLLYAGIVGLYAFVIFSRARKPEYLLSVPVVYFLEHLAYMFGFWRGTIVRITSGGPT